MEFKKLKIEDLIPASYNPRKDLKPGDKEYEKIKNSVNEFGYVDPIIINKDMTIIGGHQRVKVLKYLGYKEVDCVIVDVDKTKEKALNVALNKVTGSWQEGLLAELLKDLQELDYDVSFTGFEPPEIEELFNNLHDKESHNDSFDVAAAMEEASFVRLGDVWTLGRHRLMCGDATNADDVKILMAGKKANLCVTDPPYNCDIKGATGLKIMNDHMDEKDFYEFLLSAFKNIYDNLADGGAIYIFHSDAEKVNFFNATVAAGFHYSTTCIWVKNSLIIGGMDYQMRHESIIYAFKNTIKHKWYSDRKQTSIWEFDRPTKSKLHPTMKSIELIAYPIRNSSQINEIVLDLFGGSGSTIIACDQIDRIAYLMELDPKYASVIVKRYIKNVEDQTDGVSVMRNGQKLTFEEAVLKTEEVN